MKTIWGLFKDYKAAREVVDTLQHSGFSSEEINVVLLESALPETKRESGKPAKTEKPATGRSSGLDRLLATSRPRALAGSRSLLAAGPLGQKLADLAFAAEGDAGRLLEALTGLGVPATYARFYATGVQEGQVLLILHIPDERERQAVKLMRRHQVAYIGGLPG